MFWVFFSPFGGVFVLFGGIFALLGGGVLELFWYFLFFARQRDFFGDLIF